MQSNKLSKYSYVSLIKFVTRFFLFKVCYLFLIQHRNFTLKLFKYICVWNSLLETWTLTFSSASTPTPTQILLWTIVLRCAVVFFVINRYIVRQTSTRAKAFKSHDLHTASRNSHMPTLPNPNPNSQYPQTHLIEFFFFF